MRSRRFFRRLQQDVGGMLTPGVYQTYYRMARNEACGSIIELGTGQGASTIALATGIMDSGRSARVHAVDQFYQYGVGPHPAGRKRFGEKALSINLSAYEGNLTRYGVDEYVEIHAGKTTEVEIDCDRQGPFDMLVIDVDGYIDRDFSVFFDCIDLNGLIVIDDYRDAVNKHGREALERFSAKARESARREVGEMSSYGRGRILGKHLLTYRLISRFEELGLIRIEEDLGGTVVCRKSTTESFGRLFSPGDAQAVEESIVSDFDRMIDSGRSDWMTRPWLGRVLRSALRRMPGKR